MSRWDFPLDTLLACDKLRGCGLVLQSKRKKNGAFICGDAGAKARDLRNGLTLAIAYRISLP